MILRACACAPRKNRHRATFRGLRARREGDFAQKGGLGDSKRGQSCRPKSTIAHFACEKALWATPKVGFCVSGGRGGMSHLHPLRALASAGERVKGKRARGHVPCSNNPRAGGQPTGLSVALRKLRAGHTPAPLILLTFFALRIFCQTGVSQNPARLPHALATGHEKPRSTTEQSWTARHRPALTKVARRGRRGCGQASSA